EGMVLKPNMVIAGQKSPKQASPQEVAERTIKCLKACVPAAVPGIAFLSGGQTDEQATEHLSLMNAMGNLPWKLTFSYGRALQAAALKAWGGKPENVAAGQRAFAHRAKMNGLASLGRWERSLEQAAQVFARPLIYRAGADRLRFCVRWRALAAAPLSTARVLGPVANDARHRISALQSSGVTVWPDLRPIALPLELFRLRWKRQQQAL